MTDPIDNSGHGVPRPRARWLRRLGMAAAALLVIVVALVALLQLPPVATFVVRRLLTLAPLNPGNRLQVGRVSGNLFQGVTLEDVVLEQDGRILARVSRLRLGYRLPRLRPPVSRLDELDVDGAEVSAHRRAGEWDLLRVLRHSADTTSRGGGFAIGRLRVRDIAVAAELAPDSVAHLRIQDFAARELAIGDTARVGIDSLRMAIQPPASGRWLSVATRGGVTGDEIRLDPIHINSESSAVSGRIVIPRRWETAALVDRLDVQLAAHPLDLVDLAALTPAVPASGHLRLDARARGRGDLVTASLAASIASGRVRLDGGTRLRNGKPGSYQLRGMISRLDPSKLSTKAPAGTVNARLDADVEGPWRRTDGTARLQLDRTRLGGTTVRRLDLGARFTDGAVDLTLTGALDSGSVRARGQARPFDSLPSYSVTGSAVGMPGTGAVARALAGSRGNPALDVGFNLAGRGTSPDSATVRGRVDLRALRRAEPSVAVGHARLRLERGRLELRPELLVGGGTITAVGRVALGDTLRYELRDGRIASVDLGKLAGDTILAPLNGRFAVTGHGTAPDSAVVSANLHLDELHYGGRRVDRVDVVAHLDRGRVHLDGQGAMQGGRVVLEALGRPFDSTASYVLRRAGLDSVDLGTFLGNPGLAGPVTLTVTGEARLHGAARAARARITVDTSQIGRVQVTGGDADLRLDGAAVAYDATVRSAAGTVELKGDGTAGDSAFYRVREGRLTAVDLGRLLGRAGLRTDLNTSFTAQVAGRGPDSLRGALDLTLLPSRVNQAELTGGSLTTRMAAGRLEARVQAEGPDAALDAMASGTPQAARRAMSTAGTLRLEHLAKWTGRGDADGRVESRFSLAVESDSSGLRTLGGTVHAIGGIGDVRVPTFDVTLRPAEGELALDTMLVRSNVAAIDGGGRMRLQPGGSPGALSLRATLGDLAPLATLMGGDTVGVDSARMRLDVTGPAHHWKLQSRGEAHGVAFGGNLANHIALAGSVTLDSGRVGAVSGDLRVQDAAYGKLSLREVTAVGGYDSTLALDLNLNVADSVQVATRIRGTITAARDTIRADLQRLTLDEGGRHWALERPATLGFGPRVEIGHLVLGAGGRSIAVNGVLDRRGSSDLTVKIASLDLEALQAAGIVPVGGRVDGDLHLTGPAASPRLQGKLGLGLRSSRGQQVGTVSSDVDWTDRGLRIAAAATPLRGSALTVQGTLPYRLTFTPRDTSASVGSEALASDAVSLGVHADSFALSLLQPLLPPDVARGLVGRLRADVKIGGTMRAARASGDVELTRAAVEVPTIRVAYEGGELTGRLDGDVLKIERLRLLTGKKQELTGTGSIRLSPLSEPGLALSGTLQDFRLVNSDQLQTAGSGKVEVTGTLLKPVVRGNVRLNRTDFYASAGATQTRVEDVTLTPEQLRQLARDFGPSVLLHGKKTPGLMDRATLDLAVEMPSQVWIRKTGTPKANIELMGRVRLTQQPGQDMQFFGHVEPVPDRGTLELSGREFRIAEGDINLAGPIDSTKLDVNATYQVPTQGNAEDEGVEILVHARGRLDSLGLEFSSDPSMSQDDILSYIVTGRPASDNALFEHQGAGGGNAGEQVAFSTLSSAISNAAGKSLGFDVFQIRQEPTRGLTLTAGRYVSSRMFLDLELPLQVGSQGQQVPGENLGPGFELEYRLQRWLRSSLRGGSLSPGVLFKARRAY
jgi:translocation and assembly module TamB